MDEELKKDNCKIIQAPVTTIWNRNTFCVTSHITSTNSRLQLNREEAALLYIELHKFLFK